MRLPVVKHAASMVVSDSLISEAHALMSSVPGFEHLRRDCFCSFHVGLRAEEKAVARRRFDELVQQRSQQRSLRQLRA